MNRLRVGDRAPDFTAEGTGGRKYRLHDYLGHPVVLVFYPGDSTPTCTAQLGEYTDTFDEFEKFDANVFALSPQDVESHEKFQAKHHFAFPLLYDEDKRIGHEYGVVGPLGFYRRTVFVVDRDGNIAHINKRLSGLTYPRMSELRAALQAAG